jgi:hypothetical protein
MTLQGLARIAMLCSALGCNACSGFAMHPNAKALPFALKMTPPSGPPEYTKGWTDGCESAFSGRGTHMQKIFNHFRFDPYMVQNATYNRVWHDAYRFCGAYTLSQDISTWFSLHHKT